MIFFTMASPRPVPFRLVRDVRLGQARAIMARQADAVVGDGDARPPSPAADARASIRPAPSRIATASAAFCSRLVSAWPSRRRSQRRYRPALGDVGAPRDVRDARSAAAPAPRAPPARYPPGCITGCGMRAKAENSSTMRPMSPTWRTIVSAHCVNVSGSEVISRAKRRLQPLGRKLDRRQRILDLVRDAARDIGPGGLALRRLQLGDVVEGGDEAERAAPALSRRLAARARRRCAPAACAAPAWGRSAPPRYAAAPAPPRPPPSGPRTRGPPPRAADRSRRAGRSPAGRSPHDWAARSGPARRARSRRPRRRPAPPR